MPATTYKRIDYDQCLYLVQYLFTKLASSPLADNTTYTASFNSSTRVLTLTPSTGGTAVTVEIPTITVDSALSGSSSNPVQNQVIKEALDLKAPLVSPALTGVPTAPTASSGTNTTQIATTAFVAAAITAAISSITGITFTKVNSYSDLPATGSSGTIYLVPNSGSAPNVYDEYFWDTVTSGYEKLGTTDVDLSGYVQSSQMAVLTNTEITTIVDDAYDAVFNPSSGS